MPTSQIILSILGLIGISGIITALLNKKKDIEFRKLENKEKRYKSALLYMDVYFAPENIKYLSNRLPDIHGQKDVLEYLKAEFREMALYASREVILAIKVFIEKPSRENFGKAVLVMRKDLWVKKVDLEIEDISV